MTRPPAEVVEQREYFRATKLVDVRDHEGSAVFSILLAAARVDGSPIDSPVVPCDEGGIDEWKVVY